MLGSRKELENTFQLLEEDHIASDPPQRLVPSIDQDLVFHGSLARRFVPAASLFQLAAKTTVGVVASRQQPTIARQRTVARRVSTRDEGQ